jgi:UDP-N-acetylmuramoyl-L-alanyl-D-glutamate--2,6-diaminopimelate ligase
MKLRSLLNEIADLGPVLAPLLETGAGSGAEHPALDQEVTGLSTNSHAVSPGDLFLGMPGARVDGGEFWPSAMAAGAIAALVSPNAIAKRPPQATDAPGGQAPLLIPVADMVGMTAKVAAAFYGFPTHQLKMVGVTGTNGKTTTTHLIEYFLNESQNKTAMLGTLYTRWPGYEKTAAHTTPFSADLQAQLAEALQAGCTYGVMEVSSHALHQRRVAECAFEVAVFTNLTQDHLDYHPTMEDYFAAKALLFGEQYLRGRAIVNLDDPYGERLVAQLGEKVWSYSTHQATADLWMSDLVYGPTGVSGQVHSPTGSAAFTSPLVGQFNLENLLAALGTGLHLGLSLEMMLGLLPQFLGVPGRMERVQVAEAQDISVIVDYAHTPDSLENLLKASRPFISGKVICVFGCGGDRDRTKRPKMGAIAAQLADVAVVTSDNPRTEDPQMILQDVLAGIPATAHPIVEADRAAAIRQAILTASPGDGVLIAGKGHEDYQILGTEKVHFDDREQSREALLLRLKS